ncbi:MAG: AbrB/MazE/SpoVT family DNA-binding domain-containing protein [Planctomycetota bacterium]|jgi:AbrB family looped-hinge helix DNA binding protein
MVAESTVTSKGQITLPIAVREALGVRAGDRLVWSTRPDGVLEVRKIQARSLTETVGLLGTPKRTRTIEELDDALRARFGKE